MSAAPALSLDASPLPVAERFRLLLHHLHLERGRACDQEWFQIAAALLMASDAPPERLAHGLRGFASQLKRESGWLEPERGPLRHLIAGMLLPTGIAPEAFLHLARRDAERLHAAGASLEADMAAYATAVRLVLGHAQGLSTVLALRIAHLQRVLSSHCWRMQRVRLLPLAMLMALEHGDTEELADRASRIHACAVSSGLDASDDLRRACQLLVLTGLEPAPAIARLRALADACGDHGGHLSVAKPTALAVLCLLERDPLLIARTVHACVERLGQGRPPLSGVHAVFLAVDLTCCSLARAEHGGLEAPPTQDEAASIARRGRVQVASVILHLDRMHALQDLAILA